MEPFTLNRDLTKKDVIDNFSSIIWTERYYGDSQVELVVPATPDLIEKLPEGVLLGLPESDEIMILESPNIEDGKLKTTGIGLLPWMNNRFVRASAAHEDRYWYPDEAPPGQLLWDILYYMCCAGSPYLTTGSNVSMGISNPERLGISGLGLKGYDSSGPSVKWAVPYGPVYTAMRDIATTYQIGMKIAFSSEGFRNFTRGGIIGHIGIAGKYNVAFPLGFYSYKGLNRTSNQGQESNFPSNPIVRFSPQTDSLTNIKELRSIAALKTLAFAFAPGNPDGLATGLAPGESSLSTADNTSYTGFDLRAMMIFADDLTTDMLGANRTVLTEILNNRAVKGLAENPYIRAVDGEIVPTNELKYGRDYNLGDLVEVQGNSGIIQISRITEYIRSQDESGEKSYPTMMAYTE